MQAVHADPWAAYLVSRVEYSYFSNIDSNKGRVVGVIVGPRVIDAGLSLVTALLAPVAVAAGYPSPAQDYFDGRIDLNEHLVKDVTSSRHRPGDRAVHGAGRHQRR